MKIARNPGTLLRVGLMVSFLLVAGAAYGNTITVNSAADVAADDGQCTLREAIIASNANTASGAMAGECAAGSAGLDTITFNIPVAGVQTITLLSNLPTITEAVFINGYTQPGATPNTNALNAGINAVLLIEVDGTSGGQLNINASGTTIRGIVFNRGGDQIRIAANNVTIAGNFIGTNPAGTVAMGNPGGGYAIRQDPGNNNVIGGPGAADRNLLSGNAQGGVSIDNGDGTMIQGNYIGTDITGTASLNGTISQVGVDIRGPAFFNTTNTVISGNLISGNGGGGVVTSSTGGVLIQGNLIGTQRDGVAALGNGQIGVYIPAGSGNVVGGTGPGQANTIAFNAQGGVAVDGPGGFDNLISGNSLFSNGFLGIRLSNTGAPLANDACDVDTLPGNRGQNYPVITSAVIAAGNVTISGTLNSTQSADFQIEFFSNVACDPSGNGEGQTFLGFANVTTPVGGCDVSFGPLVFPVPPGQTFITASATELPFNTSEFSACFTAGGAPPTPTLTPTPTSTPPGPTATSTPTPVGGAPAAIPTLSPTSLLLLGLALGLVALSVLRKNQ
jgi:CSLREA domain-containing protein